MTVATHKRKGDIVGAMMTVIAGRVAATGTVMKAVIAGEMKEADPAAIAEDEMALLLADGTKRRRCLATPVSPGAGGPLTPAPLSGAGWV